MKDDFIRLNDNKVTLYQRSLKSGDIWYGRFSIDKDKRHLCDDQKYITESMKTTERSVAIETAKNRFLEITFNSKNDISIKGKLVRDGIDDFLKIYRDRLSINSRNRTRRGSYSTSMMDIYQRSLKFWREYVGDLQFNQINRSHYDNYEFWRKTYSERNEVHHASKDNISDASLQIDLNCFKKLMRWCLEEKYFQGHLIDYKFTAKKVRRTAFSLDEYMKIVRYLRTNEYLEKRTNNDHRKIEHRKLFRSYFLFMSNVGLRKSEARELKWRDVQFDEKNGKQYVRVRVSRNTKTGKSREAIGRLTARRSLERIREFRDHHLGENDYIFCDREGNSIRSMVGIFNNVMDEVGCKYNSDGEGYCIYTLRHTYITFRLRYSNQNDVYAIARNCGTSVSMIERYYDDTHSLDYIDKLI